MDTLKRREYFESENPISIRPMALQPDFPEHSHEFDELVMVRSGCALHYVNGQPYHISKGSVFYLSGGKAHGFEQSENLCLTNVLFEPQQLQMAHLNAYLPSMPERDALPLNVSTGAMDTCERLFAAITHENASLAAGSKQMVEALFSQLVILLWREHRRQLDCVDGDSRLAALIRHLDAHMAEEVDFDQLAERFRIPLRTLHRRMLETTGLSPASYLGRMRLCTAMRMLSHSEASVTDIAFACGFNDSNYFSSRFHKEIGISPGQYRKRALGLPS